MQPMYFIYDNDTNAVLVFSENLWVIERTYESLQNVTIQVTTNIRIKGAFAALALGDCVLYIPDTNELGAAPREQITESMRRRVGSASTRGAAFAVLYGLCQLNRIEIHNLDEYWINKFSELTNFRSGVKLIKEVQQNKFMKPES
jgi:hypothetical protein